MSFIFANADGAILTLRTMLRRELAWRLIDPLRLVPGYLSVVYLYNLIALSGYFRIERRE